MTKKEIYSEPEVKVINLCLSKAVLTVSNRGFVDDEDYNGNRWGLN